MSHLFSKAFNHKVESLLSPSFEPKSPSKETSFRSKGFLFVMKLLIASLALSCALPALAQRSRVDNAPKVGEAIPKVSAVTLTDKKKVDLSKPEKVTVLIFGSHT